MNKKFNVNHLWWGRNNVSCFKLKSESQITVYSYFSRNFIFPRNFTCATPIPFSLKNSCPDAAKAHVLEFWLKSNSYWPKRETEFPRILPRWRLHPGTDPSFPAVYWMAGPHGSVSQCWTFEVTRVSFLSPAKIAGPTLQRSQFRSDSQQRFFSLFVMLYRQHGSQRSIAQMHAFPG